MSYIDPLVNPKFAYAKPWYSLLLLFLNRPRFIELAISHSMAVSLEASDLQRLHSAGKFLKIDWKVDAEKQAKEASKVLYAAFLTSFLWMLAASCLSILVAVLFEKISFELTISISKLLSTIGSFFAGWGTVFQLGTPIASWKGRTLPELVHTKIFLVLFILGVVTAILGQLW
jgi:hypothetical protein